MNGNGRAGYERATAAMPNRRSEFREGDTRPIDRRENSRPGTNQPRRTNACARFSGGTRRIRSLALPSDGARSKSRAFSVREQKGASTAPPAYQRLSAGSSILSAGVRQDSMAKRQVAEFVRIPAQLSIGSLTTSATARAFPSPFSIPNHPPHQPHSAQHQDHISHPDRPAGERARFGVVDADHQQRVIDSQDRQEADEEAGQEVGAAQQD